MYVLRRYSRIKVGLSRARESTERRDPQAEGWRPIQAAARRPARYERRHPCAADYFATLEA